MATSLLDRLLSPWKTEGKAAIGAGVFPLTWGRPLHSLSKQQNRLMQEAQAIFHSNGWVGAAERALGGRFTRMDWHLEDENDKVVDVKSPEPYQEVLRLLERPSEKKTRRQTWSITFRHLGLAGNGFWYLDQRDLRAGTPLQVMYINPARMTPATRSNGEVIGWVLDGPENPVTGSAGNPGVPLETEEIIHFPFDEPDWGVWGIGIPESAQRKIDLDRLTETHAGGVLATGGRLTGLITPKSGETINEDNWTQFVRDWRRITDDPDAAKRLQLAKQPLDFTQMSASPKDLQLVDVNKANRDDILAMWGMPQSQLGINVPAGLNADRSEADDAAIWETVKQRSEPFKEKVQFEFLDRWQALGVKVTLVFDYPEFDDHTPEYEAVEKSVNAPITNDERRAILGLESLEDKELGKAIYVHSSLVRIDKEPEPQTSPPSGTPVVPFSTEDEEDVVEGKASPKPYLGLRQKTATTWEPKIRSAVASVLAAQRSDVTARIRKHAAQLSKKPTDSSVWWNEGREEKRVMAALEPLLGQMARMVADETTNLAKKPGKADTFLERVLAMVRRTVGERIKGINSTTREKVQSAVAEGVERGLGPAELGNLIEDSAAFDEYRSELIARTETAQVYNDAAIESYRSLEVTEVQAIDGDDDAECAARNGKVYSVGDAQGVSDHPNGTLDWIPVFKASTGPLGKATATATTTLSVPAINITMPELPAPIVNITTPEVRVPDVFVDNSGLAETIARIEAAMTRPKTIERDADGRIVGVK